MNPEMTSVPDLQPLANEGALSAESRSFLPVVGASTVKEGLLSLLNYDNPLALLAEKPSERYLSRAWKYAEAGVSVEDSWEHDFPIERHSVAWFINMFDGGAQSASAIKLASYDVVSNLPPDKQLQLLDTLRDMTASIESGVEWRRPGQNDPKPPSSDLIALASQVRVQLEAITLTAQDLLTAQLKEQAVSNEPTWESKVPTVVAVPSLLFVAATVAGCTTPPSTLPTNVVNEGTIAVAPATEIPQSPLGEPDPIESPVFAPSEEAPAVAEPTQPAIVSVETPTLTGPLEFTAVVPYTEVLHGDDIVDLNSARAVYAFFRAEGRTFNPSSDEAFIAEMSKWAKELEDVPALKAQKISIIRSIGSDGTPVTMLVKGDGENQQVLLDFRNDDGTLLSATPGGWSPKSTSKWINVRGKAGLVVGPDRVGYVTQMNGDGTDVLGYLNPYGGTSLDNVHERWITVKDGMPEKVWNGTEWVKSSTEQLTQTNRGPVYVNAEGRLMLVNSEGGESPIAFENLEFESTKDASAVVKAMYPNEFKDEQSLTRKPDITLAEFLFPAGLDLPGSLKYLSEGQIVEGYDSERGIGSFDVYGEFLEATTVDGQITIFLAVPGCREPVPYVITRSNDNNAGISYLAFPRDPMSLGSDYTNTVPNGGSYQVASPDVRKISDQLSGKRVLAKFLTKITALKGSPDFDLLVQKYGEALGGDNYFGQDTSLVMFALKELEAEGAEITQGSVLQRAIELAEVIPGWTGFLPFGLTFPVFTNP